MFADVFCANGPPPHRISCGPALCVSARPKGKKNDEYEKGYEAAISGKALANCPFHSSSVEAIAWCNGWNDAIGAELKAIRQKRMRA